MLRIVITLAVYMFLGWLLCDIEAGKEYTWYSGIWHGIFFVNNWIRSWFGDALYKAETYTGAYNFFFWIFSIISVVGIFSSGARR